MNGATNENDSHMTLDDLFALMDKAGYSAREAFGAIYGLGLNNEYEIRRFGDLEQAEDGCYLDPVTGIEVELDLECFEPQPDDDLLLGYGPDMSLKVEAWPAFELEDVRHVACDVGLLDYDAPLDEKATAYLIGQRAEADRRRSGASLHGSASTREMLDLEADKARERAERASAAKRTK